MNQLWLIMGLLFALGLQQAQAADGHCTETTKQTSMDFDGPVTLPQPRVIHTYEEAGGNLDLESQIELARQQCAQMGLGGAEFAVVASQS